MSDDVAQWFAGKDFSTDWTSRYFPIWSSLFSSHRGGEIDVLEIGSWEGRSAVFFLRYFGIGRLTCIDTFGGSAEHVLRPKWSEQLLSVESRFDANLAEFDGRVRKMKLPSYQALAQLITEGRQFDLVYVDGSHHSADVHRDTAMAWPMIRDRGIMIFDDYEWNFFADNLCCPKIGVDAFLTMHRDAYRELHRDYQVIIEKNPAEPYITT